MSAFICTSNSCGGRILRSRGSGQGITKHDEGKKHQETAHVLVLTGRWPQLSRGQPKWIKMIKQIDRLQNTSEYHGTSWKIMEHHGTSWDLWDTCWILLTWREGPALVSAEAKTPRWHPAKASRKPSRELRSPKTRPPPPRKATKGWGFNSWILKPLSDFN